MKRKHTQETLCQLAELDQAAKNHDKMAEMHERAGSLRLATSARGDAYERRLAYDYLDNAPEHGLCAALDYAALRRKASI